jgi:DNA phosphorothioation-associated putative methyltransferase
VQVERHKTALHRNDLSRPVRLALDDGLISEKCRVFDYGCGRGGDVRRLRDRGITAWGWDPVHAPRERKRRADVVNFGYVANVIDNPTERRDALREAWKLTDRVLVVAARLTLDERSPRGPVWSDGCVTQLGTFQKYFEQSELREWIERSLGAVAIPSQPGIFYVFRDEGAREAFNASRWRERIAAPRVRRSDAIYEQHRPLFEALQRFLVARGRPPGTDELKEGREIVSTLGSIPRAFGILRRVTREAEWEAIRVQRRNDTLLYLALARFGGRPRFVALPDETKLDVRYFFGTYRHACSLADGVLLSLGDRELLDRACRQSSVGKVMPSALYVHRSALPDLSLLLRAYEGCAARYVGVVGSANVVKLHRDGGTISYLSYPRFDEDGHPCLAGALTVSLRSFRLSYRDYRGADNPPILHRKEEFVSASYPLARRFARLSSKELALGLLRNSAVIGNEKGWGAVLEKAGLQIAGHTVKRTRTV